MKQGYGESESGRQVGRFGEEQRLQRIGQRGSGPTGRCRQIAVLTCPTVRSAGTRYFFLSIAAISLLSAFSQMTYSVPRAQEGDTESSE